MHIPTEQCAREDFAFFYPLRVRWSEVDPQNIVFNPNYLVYADIAMTEYMPAIPILTV
jgi:acyl-CoA thioester hydrolase